MKKIHLEILKYLDQHYTPTSPRVDVRGAKSKLPSDDEIKSVLYHLEKYKYVELDSIYDHYGIEYAGEASSFERPLPKAKITKEGIDYLSESKEKQDKKRGERITMILTFIGILVAAVVGWQAIMQLLK